LLGARPDHVLQLGAKPQKQEKVPESRVNVHLLGVFSWLGEVDAVFHGNASETARVLPREDLDGGLGTGYHVFAYLLQKMARGGV
jgi:hypothetical protein